MRLLALLVVLFLVGCVAPSAELAPATSGLTDRDAIGASRFVAHDHSDRAQHQDLARGLTVAAWVGEYSEADAANGIIAVTASIAGGGTFVLLEANALPEIKVLSRTGDPGAHGDVKLDPVKPLLDHVTETFSDAAPHSYIVDMTDLAAPVLLADWTPPGIPHDDSIRFSAHDLNLAGTRAYLANFHGGLWVLDVSDPAAPQVIAHRMSVRDTAYPEKGKMLLDDVSLDENAFWDVIIVHGYALVTDMPAGIEVLAVDGDPHGDTTHTSIG